MQKVWWLNFPCLTHSFVYKGHIIRDTFLRFIKFLRRLVLGIKFMVMPATFTIKMLENEADYSNFRSIVIVGT